MRLVLLLKKKIKKKKKLKIHHFIIIIKVADFNDASTEDLHIFLRERERERVPAASDA
jgi:hypothetical protein